ncbi:hypothetical protein EMIHUDRAFT_193814 [Emiliania huxleyi CCMP1516]|uniref:Peptidase S1 domain-containing protein n=2 Tax=Emiliania huxleyi TaxID=2903 RepID=A0A0D3L0G8_EMIH1|nr:hypothetical protein EMIHUDRAFT_193814 [Emiliania huxleyi CCMP1516]EOD41503.1 hypothetical protein EMIHUDRAFT_193814 [Emiliania huxleyi CCMP1516]|eukprot:XP_005793932.1 hypothetical protein EMIHUDRAFT_193814 [Emiliania huxleyi CCMP1516]
MEGGSASLEMWRSGGTGRLRTVMAAAPHPRLRLVSLQVAGTHDCTGTLIGRRWVLTAAHCIKSGALQVAVGLHSAKNSVKDETCAIYVQMDEKKPIQHEDYRTDEQRAEYKTEWNLPEDHVLDVEVLKANDIALIRLTDDAQYDHIEHLDNDPVTNEPNSELIVAGWNIGGGDATTGAAQYKKVQVFASDTCDSTETDNPFCFNVKLTDKMICTAPGARRGDSGGPLYKVDADGNAVLVGVTSFGPPEASPCFTKSESRVAYTRVASYTDWICDKTSGDVCPPIEDTCGCGASACRVTCTLTVSRRVENDDPDTWGTQRCYDCRPGTYSDASTGAVNGCTRCPEGTHQPKFGQGECVACNDLEFSSDDRTYCVDKLSEIRLYESSGSQLSVTDCVSNAGGDRNAGEGSLKLIDGSVNTKNCCSTSSTNVVVTLTLSPSITSAVTANDMPTFSCEHGDGVYKVLDQQTGVSAPNDRKTAYPTYNL